MATVRMWAVYPAGAEVELRRQVGHSPLGSPLVAIGTVDEQSMLEFDGLELGGYWACFDGQAVGVRAKDVPGSSGAPVPAVVMSEEEVRDALAKTRPAQDDVHIVKGARTTTNTRARRKSPPVRAVAAAKKKLTPKKKGGAK